MVLVDNSHRRQSYLETDIDSTLTTIDMQLCAPLPAQLRAVCRLVAFTPRHISSFHSSSRCHRPREGPVADAKGRRGMAELMRMEKEEEEQAIPGDGSGGELGGKVMDSGVAFLHSTLLMRFCIGHHSSF